MWAATSRSRRDLRCKKANPRRKSEGISWSGPESNRRHRDFQSRALPTELPDLSCASETGSNPDTRFPAVTYTENARHSCAWRDRYLNDAGRPAFVGDRGLEPLTSTV